jgi:hypothetical protein
MTDSVPGAPLDLDAIEARVKARKAARTFGEGMQADIIFTNAARMDVPALCAEVRRLRTLVAEAYREGWSGAECWNDSHYVASYETLAAAWNASESRAALAPTGEPGNG